MPDDDHASLSIFSALWAVGALFHLAKWSLWADTPSNLAMMVAAVMVLARPGASLPLAGLFATQVWALAREMPHTSNHLFLAGLVGALGLLAIGRLLLRSNGVPTPGALYRDFAPPARVTALLVLFLAGFHKLNADWFQPEVSCGAEFYRAVVGRVPLLPEVAWAEWTAIVGAIVIELVAPFLLLSRRLRAAGLLISLVFLYAVGITGFFNFAAIAAALLALFAPANMGELLCAGCERRSPCRRIRSLALSPKVGRAVEMGVMVVAGTAIVVTLARPWAGHIPDPMLVRELSSGRRPMLSYAFEAAWWAFGLGLAAALLIGLRSGVARWPSATALLKHPAPALSVIPLLTFLSGVSPYFGLKTEVSFAMFSNLRTETRPNHLVVRRPADLLGLQGDLVAIESSSDSELQQIAERGYLVPLIELRAYVRARTRASGPDFTLTYVRNGRWREVERAGRDPELTRPGPALARALVAFRPVSVEGPNRCRH